jgi:hypothetical protein
MIIKRRNITWRIIITRMGIPKLSENKVNEDTLPILRSNIINTINGLGCFTGDGLATSQDRIKGNVYGVELGQRRYSLRNDNSWYRLGYYGDKYYAYHNCYNLGYFGDKYYAYHNCYNLVYYGDKHYACHNCHRLESQGVNHHAYYNCNNIQLQPTSHHNNETIIEQENGNNNKQRQYMCHITGPCIKPYPQQRVI